MVSYNHQRRWYYVTRKIFTGVQSKAGIGGPARGAGTGTIAAEHNLNPNMLRNWKAEFLEHASSMFEGKGKSEREAKRKEAAAKKKREKMLKTIGQLTIERNFLQNCFRAVGQPIPGV